MDCLTLHMNTLVAPSWACKILRCAALMNDGLHKPLGSTDGMLVTAAAAAPGTSRNHMGVCSRNLFDTLLQLLLSPVAVHVLGVCSGAGAP